MKTLTIDQVLSDHPCDTYTRGRLLKLSKGRESLTLLEVLSLRIPPEDKVWIMTRSGVLTASKNQAWKVVVCTRAITKYALHCGIPSVETWAQNWLANKDRTPAGAAGAAWTAWAARAASPDLIALAEQACS